MLLILAVDDAAAMRQRLACTLPRAGLQVSEAINGQDARVQAGERDFSQVLTDQHQPRLDGITLTGRRHPSPGRVHTPRRILGAPSSARLPAAGRNAGVTGASVNPSAPAKPIEAIGRGVH